MNDAELRRLIDDYVTGDISPEQHQTLQQVLKSDPLARGVFREIVDLEVSLHTWAAENGSSETDVLVHGRLTSAVNSGRGVRWYAALAMAASIAVFVASGWFWWQTAGHIADRSRIASANLPAHLGTLVQQDDCLWGLSKNVTSGSRFGAGSLSLVSGVAKLQFDSGTDILLQGPCELRVDSADNTHLLAGNVVVHVTELSDGFTLTTPDATIVDEGTEYAVSLDDKATEVHVFDGSVFWEPRAITDKATVERIEAGEARRYLRSGPTSGARIPLEMRKFVRQIEADVQENAGDGLLAYDGFENLAGRIRRGRSGFGWSGGWTSGFRGRGNIGTIIDAPDGTVFGIQRTGLRLLQLADGEAVLRDLEQPLVLDPGVTFYISFIVKRHPGEPGTSRYLQASLSNEAGHARRRSRNELAFGLTSDGFPFIKAGGKNVQSAPPIEDDHVYLFVGKVVVTEERDVETYLRIYRASESIEPYEPSVWTTISRPSTCEFSLFRIQFAVGTDTIFDIDELKIGTTWRSVTTVAQVGDPPPFTDP